MGEDYQGGRTYEPLAKFATENLKAVCSPAKIELCDDDKKAKIAELSEMSSSDLTDAIKTAEANFKAEVEKLQATYTSLMEKKDADIDAVKKAGLGLMKSVQAYKAKSGTDEL